MKKERKKERKKEEKDKTITEDTLEENIVLLSKYFFFSFNLPKSTVH